MKKILLMTLAVLAISSAFAEESFPERAGNGIKNVGEAAGRGIEKGAAAAGRGIQKGGEETVKGLDIAGNWVDRKLHADGKKTEKASGSK